MTVAIIILAAGKGTRMKSTVPKVLHKLAGKTLLDHVLEASNSLSNNITVVVGHEAQQVQQSANTSTHFATQQLQLGTGHAVMQALPLIGKAEKTLILYGDVPLIQQATLARLLELTNEKSLGLLTVSLTNPTGYGRIIRDACDSVTEIVEQKDADSEQLLVSEVNTGIMALATKHLKSWLPQLSNDNAQSEYYLTDLIAIARKNGINIATHNPQSEQEVAGVNDRMQLAALERYYQRTLAEKFMLAGNSLQDPARFDCRGSLTTGIDNHIDVNCIFEGEVRLGSNISIGPNCCLKDCVIDDNVQIKANSVIEGALIGEAAIIGPFARLRPGTQLAAETRLGNFVETKNVIVGKGSKINHLSYIGDAELGIKVNVGAGTITCNYDGANKHRTTIGDEAFIGSNTSLVAPVTVGAKATVGAGSTITKQVADSELALARSRQISFEGWKRPAKKIS